jgi:hypothetical protein
MLQLSLLLTRSRNDVEQAKLEVAEAVNRANELEHELIQVQAAKDALEDKLRKENDEHRLHKLLNDDIQRALGSGERQADVRACSYRCGGLILAENMTVRALCEGNFKTRLYYLMLFKSTR